SSPACRSVRRWCCILRGPFSQGEGRKAKGEKRKQENAGENELHRRLPRPSPFAIRHSPRGALEQRPISRRSRDPQMPIRCGGGNTASRSSLEEAGLNEVGLIQVFEGPAILSQRSGDGTHTHRSASELFDDRLEDPAVQFVEAVLVHFQP